MVSKFRRGQKSDERKISWDKLCKPKNVGGMGFRDLINSIFLPHDADSILSIPLSVASPVDHKVWSATANGVFSVCSA